MEGLPENKAQPPEKLRFNTGMTGYQEIFTDPSYFGQLMVTTHTHIGNYGIEDTEKESNSVKIAGLICRNFCEIPSRKKASGTLKDYLINNNIVAISDVDTRALVRHLRDKGAMNGIISSKYNRYSYVERASCQSPPDGRVGTFLPCYCFRNL